MSPPGTLQLGDCFDIPATRSDVVDSIQHHPCTDSHNAEVRLVTLYTSDMTDYPDSAALDRFIGTTCVPAFRGYAGVDLSSRPELSLGYFFPSINAWAQGDRTIECYVMRADQGTMSESVRSSATP